MTHIKLCKSWTRESTHHRGEDGAEDGDAVGPGGGARTLPAALLAALNLPTLGTPGLLLGGRRGPLSPDAAGAGPSLGSGPPALAMSLNGRLLGLLPLTLLWLDLRRRLLAAGPGP